MYTSAFFRIRLRNFSASPFISRLGARAGCVGLRYASVLSREEQVGKELNPVHPWRRLSLPVELTVQL